MLGNPSKKIVENSTLGKVAPIDKKDNQSKVFWRLVTEALEHPGSLESLPSGMARLWRIETFRELTSTRKLDTFQSYVLKLCFKIRNISWKEDFLLVKFKLIHRRMKKNPFNDI